MSRSRRRCLVASAAICVLCASTAQAQAPAPERTVAAQGVASVKVVAPKDRKHEAPIRAAVEAGTPVIDSCQAGVYGAEASS